MSARNVGNFRLVAAEYPTLNPRTLGVEALALTEADEILQAPAKSLPACVAVTLPWRDEPWIERLFRELTFTHLVEFARIEDPIERAFYELHCLREGWATRDLIRQRNTLIYQRIGLSKDRDAVLALARQGQVDQRPPALLRDPYILEFLGLGEANVVQASQPEDAMLEHLQRVLRVFGREFCFVARQFRITVGNRHRNLDLLF